MSVRLRPMKGSDIGAATELTVSERWNQTVADWERLLGASPDGCFVAVSGEKVIGTVSTIVYEERVAWVGMLIVAPSNRGCGTGRALLEAAINHLVDIRRVPCLKLDATPAGRPLYQKYGFIEEFGVERWVLSRATVEPSRSAGTAPDLLDSILALDAATFGAGRANLLRSIAEEDPDFVLVDQNSAGISGFTLGRRGAFSDHIGPCVAGDREAAGRLIRGFLARARRSEVTIDRALPNDWMPSLLERLGFTFVRSLTRMYLGVNANPGMPERCCAILGPEFG